MGLADLGQHGFGVVVPIQMLKRPDLLGLVRRVREPAQVGEVVKGEAVTALIAGGLDHRHDSQPLRVHIVESVSLCKRGLRHRLGARRRQRPGRGERLCRRQLSAQHGGDTVSSQGACRAPFHLNVFTGTPEPPARLQLDAGDDLRLVRNREQPFRHGQSVGVPLNIHQRLDRPFAGQQPQRMRFCRQRERLLRQFGRLIWHRDHAFARRLFQREDGFFVVPHSARAKVRRRRQCRSAVADDVAGTRTVKRPTVPWWDVGVHGFAHQVVWEEHFAVGAAKQSVVDAFSGQHADLGF